MNADDVPELVALIKRYKPVMVINVALPYQDLTIMDACLEAGVHYMVPRLQCVRDELLTGAVLFSAVFLINEPYTCAHHRMGRILYGVLVGAITMGFRYYGVYETGVCFALLTVNSISGWMDRTESRLYQLMHRPAAGKEGAE